MNCIKCGNKRPDRQMFKWSHDVMSPHVKKDLQSLSVLHDDDFLCKECYASLQIEV